MKIVEYVPLAVRTEKPLPTLERLVHGCMGLITEIGEVATELKRMHIYGKPLDAERKAHLLEEAGDVMWYVAIMLDATGIDLQIVQDTPGMDSQDAAFLHPSDTLALTLSVHCGQVCSLISYTKYESESCKTPSPEYEGRLFANLSMIIFGMIALSDLCGSNLEDTMAANIAKLQIRYPDKYSNEAAEGRADKAGADARVS